MREDHLQICSRILRTPIYSGHVVGVTSQRLLSTFQSISIFDDLCEEGIAIQSIGLTFWLSCPNTVSIRDYNQLSPGGNKSANSGCGHVCSCPNKRFCSIGICSCTT